MANAISQTLTTTTTMLLLVAFSTLIPTIDSLCSHAMVTSLSSSGFSLFAHALRSHNLTTTATPLTYLAPHDTSLLNHPLNANTLHAHVSSAGAFPYHSLLSLSHNSTLPTLHHNTTLIVGIDGKRVSFNNVLLVVPNLYIDGSCVVHGVDGPLIPIPSPVDDDYVPNPRMESTKRSSVSPRRRASQLAGYVRFIRRANRPSLVEENERPRLP